MANILKNQTGSSMIEICITLVIITITTALIMSFSRSSYSMSADARARETAFLAAEEKLADLTTKAFPVASSTSEPLTIDNVAMNRSWTINNVNTIKRATVTVSYTISGKSRSITLSGAVN
jgi:Tfp pilus assembly protein PilV